jgi:hypothetical protein
MIEQNADRKTLIVCPICQAQKCFVIPGYVLKQESVDIIKIQIHNPSVCEHDFVTFVDHTGKVRGYELMDYQLQFTSRIGKKPTTVDKLFLEDLLETLGNFATLSVFHAFLFNYRVMIITGFAEIPKYVDLLNDLFARVFPPDVPVNDLARVIDQKDFLTLNVTETEYLILDTTGLVTHSPWGDWKRFDFENDVVKEALEIIEAKSQAQLIQQQIGKLRKWTEYILADLEKNEIVYEKDMIKKLAVEFGIKATNYHLDLCKLFVARRIAEKTVLLGRIRNKSLDRLREGLWL